MVSVRDSEWFITHLLCICFQTLLVVSSFIAFAHNAIVFDKDSTHAAVPWASVAIGTLGLSGNLALFSGLLFLENDDVRWTIEEQFYIKRTATFLGYLINSLLAGGDAVFSYAMVALIRDSPILRGACVFSALSALSSLATIYVDAAKQRRDMVFLASLRIDFVV